MLDVVREPLADRRVADLREAIAAIDVPVARVHDAEEASELLVAKAEDRVGHELLGRAAVPSGRWRFSISVTGLAVEPWPALDEAIAVAVIAGAEIALHMREPPSRPSARTLESEPIAKRGASPDSIDTIRDQSAEQNDLPVGQLSWLGSGQGVWRGTAIRARLDIRRAPAIRSWSGPDDSPWPRSIVPRRVVSL